MTRAEPQALGPPSRPWGVLVVADDEAIRTFLRAGLGASGFAVWLAADGYEGAAAYREHGPDIDLLLLDVCMPDRDGPETLTALRACAPDLPCCFMSGDIGHYTEEVLLGLGAIAVLQKPFLLGELIAQLRRLAGFSPRPFRPTRSDRVPDVPRPLQPQAVRAAPPRH